MSKSFLCTVEGKVSGGTFKTWALDAAQDLGLAGWVRFLADDKAEILLQGVAEKYESFINRLKTEAPVPDLRYQISVLDNYETEHDGFEMR